MSRRLLASLAGLAVLCAARRLRGRPRGPNEIDVKWFALMLGGLVLGTALLALTFESAEWLASVDDADLELYKLLAQVIPTLFIAFGVEIGVQWAQDAKLAAEQAGIAAAIGVFSMLGLAASLYAVAAQEKSTLLFWFSVFPTAALATWVAIAPALVRR
jgi:phosphotransferase system  glucose/maltose/N-acetylglucosamine-specific IIC component